MMVNIIDKGELTNGKRVWGADEENILLIELEDEDYEKLKKYPICNANGNLIDFIGFIERLGIIIKRKNRFKVVK
jgi:hypothetical protein